MLMYPPFHVPFGKIASPWTSPGLSRPALLPAFQIPIPFSIPYAQRTNGSHSKSYSPQHRPNQGARSHSRRTLASLRSGSQSRRGDHAGASAPRPVVDQAPTEATPIRQTMRLGAPNQKKHNPPRAMPVFFNTLLRLLLVVARIPHVRLVLLWSSTLVMLRTSIINIVVSFPCFNLNMQLGCTKS